MGRISLGFKTLQQAKQYEFTVNVVTLMTKDARFDSLRSKVEELDLKKNAWKDAIAEALRGGSDRIEKRDKCREDVSNVLVNLSFSVAAFADNNDALIEASGFDLVQKPSGRKKNPILEAPTGLYVTNVDKLGVVRLTWDSVEGSMMYAIEHQIEGSEIWYNGKYSTTPKDTVLEGYVPGQKVKFRLCSLGRTGVKSDWSSYVEIWIS
jgi:hypothetical protein